MDASTGVKSKRTRLNYSHLRRSRGRRGCPRQAKRSGYNLSNGVTIVVEATKSETATTDASAFDILREVIKYVTPATPLNF